MLRPTLSTGLYVQMVGRGTRKAEGKRDCLILDFAQNVYRHGPVDRVSRRDQRQRRRHQAGVKVGSVHAKPCPDCNELNSVGCQSLRRLRLRISAAEAGRQARDARRRGADPVGQHGVAAGDERQLPQAREVEQSRRAADVVRRVSVRPLGLFATMLPSSIAARREPLPNGSGSPSAARRRCRSRSTRRSCARTSSAVLTRSAVARNGKFWNVTERRLRRADGTCVEIDRFYQTWIINSRAPRRKRLPPQPINDEVPY